jgi:hypothetical protein
VNDIEIRAIFYDEDSRSKIREPFIPLDNTLGDPNWYEFWPILDFLIRNDLKDDVYYGFFSPKFTEKTGHTPEAVISKVRENNSSEVFLFSPAWCHLAYFMNPWEQGEIWHKGITLETQTFLDYVNFDLKLNTLVTSRRTSVYSNYVVAKKTYWDKWKDLAIKFFFYANHPSGSLARLETSYGDRKVPMKVFIQERIASIVLSNNQFEVYVDNITSRITNIFEATHENKDNLILCDVIKDDIVRNGRSFGKEMAYSEARKNVRLSKIN